MTYSSAFASLNNFSSSELKSTAAIKTITDYQKELLDVWLDHLRADNSGVYERSDNHDQCQCCTHLSDENRERYRRGV